MRRKSRDLEIFNLSFLDIISLRVGAVVLLVLISPFAESVLPSFTAETKRSLEEVLDAEARVTCARKCAGAGNPDAGTTRGATDRRTIEGGRGAEFIARRHRTGREPE